jgi:hypothetical protein
MTTREVANDEIWNMTEGLREKCENDYNNRITIEEINIWPEEGIQFIGYYQCDGDIWEKTIPWIEVPREFKEASEDGS